MSILSQQQQIPKKDVIGKDIKANQIQVQDDALDLTTAEVSIVDNQTLDTVLKENSTETHIFQAFEI